MGTSETLSTLRARYAVLHAAHPHLPPPAEPTRNGHAQPAPEPTPEPTKPVRRIHGLPTLGEQLLEAARTLPGAFTFGDLCVAAWKLNPWHWGLKGYADLCPDSHKVAAVLWGRRGLVGTGRLVREGAGFRVAGGGSDAQG